VTDGPAEVVVDVVHSIERTVSDVSESQIIGAPVLASAGSQTSETIAGSSSSMTSAGGDGAVAMPRFVESPETAGTIVGARRPIPPPMSSGSPRIETVLCRARGSSSDGERHHNPSDPSERIGAYGLNIASDRD
jgi:hypothetical protein